MRVGIEIKTGNARYKLVERLSAGHFSQAYKAEVVEIAPDWSFVKAGAAVVIKAPLVEAGRHDPEAEAVMACVVSQLKWDAMAMKQLLPVEGVARIIEFGTHDADDETFPVEFVVEEYVPGMTFDKHLAGAYSKREEGFTGVQSQRDFFRLATALSERVRQVHQHGVIHGDIKPQNIMMKDDEYPVLIDFGGSVFLDCSYARLNRERFDDNPYAPPERKTDRHGHRDDVFGLGGVLFYMATGKGPIKPLPPDDDELKDWVEEQVREHNPTLFDENCAIVDIIARCLRLKDHRMRNVDALLADLDTFGFRLAAKVKETDANGMVKRISTRVANISQRATPLRAILELQLSALETQIAEMEASGVLQVSGDHEEVISALCQYFSLLGKGDILLMRSIPAYWLPQNLGIKGRVLSMLQVLAQRDVAVQHLFVTTPTDRKDAEVRSIVAVHQSVLKRFRAAERLLDKGQLDQGGLAAFYVDVDTDTQRRVRLQRGDIATHIIPATTSGSLTNIEFALDEENTIRTVRFLGRESAREKSLSRWQAEMAKAHRLEDWLTETY